MHNNVEKYSYIPEKPTSKKYVVLNIILFAVIIVLLVLIILFSTALTTMTVSGNSMYPNLHDGDKLFLLKFGYSLDYGDIVVFSRQSNDEMSINVVKRIIALSGDTLKFDKTTNQWIVNGQPLNEPYFNGEYSIDYFDKTHDNQLFEQGITIPEGCIFVLGDNRNNQGAVSQDSHIYGPIQTSSIIGKVVYVNN